MSTVQRLLEVRTSDPDDARRRKLLNIMLMGVALICVLALLLLIPLFTGNVFSGEERSIMLVGTLAMSGGVIAIYAINRFWSGRLASTLFLLLLLLIMSFSDTPAQVAGGRALFAFTLPIIIASVLLSPWASFVFALVTSAVIAAIAYNAVIEPNVPAMLGFFLIALVSWLSSRSLEQALKALRVINQELDQRVADRTRDLSESLQREREEAGKNQAILEGIADGVLVFNNEGKIMVANPAIGTLLNRNAAQISGLTIDRLFENGSVNEVDRAAISGLLARAGQTGSSIRLRHDRKTLSVNAALVRDTGGQQIGKVAVFRDFTREAEVEEMKSVFVATVSHEMRTPLNAIMGYAEMLKEAVYGPLSPMQINITERVMNNTKRLLSIVNDLLDQAQIEAGKVTLHNRRFSPAELVVNLQSVMEKIVRDKGLDFRCSIAPELPAILTGDPDRVQQILVNLVNNAVKFTESGYIAVRLYQPDPIHWGMEVSDSGCGIPANAQKYVFEPFRQVDPSTTRTHGGIGLGLSIVKNLVSIMKGEISLKSEENRGSAFTIVLPYTIL